MKDETIFKEFLLIKEQRKILISTRVESFGVSGGYVGKSKKVPYSSCLEWNQPQLREEPELLHPPTQQ